MLEAHIQYEEKNKKEFLPVRIQSKACEGEPM